MEKMQTYKHQTVPCSLCLYPRAMGIRVLFTEGLGVIGRTIRESMNQDMCGRMCVCGPEVNHNTRVKPDAYMPNWKSGLMVA